LAAWSQSFKLERVPQRELDQPRRAHGAGDFAERSGGQRLAGGIKRNALHVVDRWIAEVRVVPNVEEVGRKSQLLALGQLDILDQRKVPVLLVRSAKNIPAQIAEVCGAEVT